MMAQHHGLSPEMNVGPDHETNGASNDTDFERQQEELNTLIMKQPNVFKMLGNSSTKLSIPDVKDNPLINIIHNFNLKEMEKNILSPKVSDEPKEV